jgi:glycosyltransferase involved in cell wall biosynthesis
MHVGFALLTLVPGRMGGSETYVRSLLHEFASGHGPERVTALLNPRAAEAYAQRAGGPVRVQAVRSFRPGRRAPARAAALLAGYAGSPLVARGLPRGLDVVHFPVTIPIPRSRLPHVVTLHDVQHHDLPDFFPRVERELRRLTYDRAARRATAVITPSDYARRRIVEVLSIPPERVEAIHHGIDHERFRPEPGERDELLLAPLGLKRPFVLYPANLWRHKNHVQLVDAFARLGRTDVELVLTGRTYGRVDALLDRARRTGARVRHLGYLDLDAMPALYRSARALVFPSLYEGFGGPPLEAMACGCPVASSTRASLAEVVGDAAVELEPESVESIADALERVVTDDEVRSRLRSAGLERARAFSWGASAERHTAIYARACATSGAPVH